MKTQTSKQSVLLRTFLLIPVLGVLFFSFSNLKEVEKEVNPKIRPETPQAILSSKKNNIKEDSALPEVKPKLLKANKLKNKSANEFNKKQKAFNDRKDLLPTINNQECDNCSISMSRKELKTLKIATNKNREITQFKIKFPKGDIATIKGNTFSDEIKTKLYLVNYGEKLTLFALKSKNKSLNSKITITLIRKRPKSKAHVYKVSENVITQTQPPKSLHSLSPNKLKETHENDSATSKISDFPLPVPAAHSKSRKSPLDHIIFMSKRGADFYYNGNKITSDEAISLVKKNSKLNMNSQSDNGKSVVHLSEDGMTIINGKMVKNKN